jgi:chemotaxis protein CheD
MDQIVVGVADCRVADAPEQVLATFALGSCIGLTAYDPKAALGGLLHFMLPDSAIDPEKGRRNPFMFADTGIPRLIEMLVARGASKHRLVVRAFGGAQMMDDRNIFEIGKRNCLAARKILWKVGILLSGEVVGGERSRTVRLEIATGRVVLQESGEERQWSGAPARKGEMPWPTVS